MNTDRPSCNYKTSFSKNVESKKSGEIKQKIHLENCEERCLNKYQDSDDGFQKAGVKGSNRRSITIMGDSMLKELKPHLMRKHLKNISDKLYVHSFSGATTKQMGHNSKPQMLSILT